ncbi:MAG: hypothetical protein OER92_05810 [Alphaproteobacteria bacterium]|nr:hypothetical protein [Alphaproteobacteria bacterium]
MPTFELIPNNSELPDWEASTHRGACRVYAADSHAARQFAENAFIDKSNHGQYRGQRKIFCPWTDQSLVRCTQVPDDQSAPLPEGVVMLPGEQGWQAVAMPPPPDDKPPAPAHSMPPDNGDVVAHDAGDMAWNADIVARVLQHQDHLTDQTRSLLAVLDEIAAAPPGDGGAQPQLPDQILDAELVALLQQTRDELRRLNAALEGATTGERKSAATVLKSILRRP